MKTIKMPVWLLVCCLTVFSCKKDDEPENGLPLIKNQIFSTPENTSGNEIIGTVLATDPDDDTLSFTLTTNSNGLFQIKNTGEIRLSSGSLLDYETQNSHALVVSVTDGTDSAKADITISVSDIDENQAPTIASQNFSVAENIDDTATIANIVATDPNNDALSFTITTTQNVFEISDSGVLKLQDGETLDFEGNDTYILNISVSDGSLTSSTDITIQVTDINEAPVFNDASNIDDVLENIDSDHVIGTILASDPEGDVILFSISSDESGLFEVNGNGEISLLAGKQLDYETATSHTLGIQISDASLSTQLDVTIGVIDVDEIAMATVTTLAGSTRGFADGLITQARFDNPRAITVDANGTVYVADTYNHKIRKITASGEVTTLAGSDEGDLNGAGTQAQFSYPQGIAVDADGNVYVSDTNNHKIKKITPSGDVTTFVGGSTSGASNGIGTAARVQFPHGLAFDADGNLLLADYGNHRIRKISPTAVVTTVAGSSQGYVDAIGVNARFYYPRQIGVDNTGIIYVMDSHNHKVRRIDTQRNVTTWAGSIQGDQGGSGSSVAFNYPQGLAVEADGTVFVADTSNEKIKKIATDQVVSDFVGSTLGFLDGTDLNTQFNKPWNITIGPNNIIYVADTNNNRIRKIVRTN
ncbi:cadherin domain-containing protein [Sediminicola luteus]|uniref:Cadherin domain-containing protein n=1 Tax=Sediminicola luteus TaxID=319238 RepID=A0A2A4GCZ4_9FLAO|nr:cadherin domain-containing protein [Sediminicola luteus]PCE66291.1 hypothetical protein B7P33_03050 [Sediminicola luteus]